MIWILGEKFPQKKYKINIVLFCFQRIWRILAYVIYSFLAFTGIVKINNPYTEIVAVLIPGIILDVIDTFFQLRGILRIKKQQNEGKSSDSKIENYAKM